MYKHLKIGGICTLVVKKKNITRERYRLHDRAIGREHCIKKFYVTFHIFFRDNL